jgi:monooxygenase
MPTSAPIAPNGPGEAEFAGTIVHSQFWPDDLETTGLMLSGVPNLGLTFGYTNASWTLKADLTSD